MHDFSQEKPVFSGTRFSVYSLQVPGPSGRFLHREAVIHPGAVVILAWLDSDTLLLIRNKRFVVGEELLELPAGTLEAGESPEFTAKKELLEETGYRAAQMEPLLQFYTTPGFCNETMHAFVASGLTREAQQLDAGEEIEVHPTTWKKALEWVREGAIKDGKTIASLLYYKAFIAQVKKRS